METLAPTVDGGGASQYFDSYDDLDVSGARWQKYRFKENSIVKDVLCGKGMCTLEQDQLLHNCEVIPALIEVPCHEDTGEEGNKRRSSVSLPLQSLYLYHPWVRRLGEPHSKSIVMCRM
jgi:hypothetical protein